MILRLAANAAAHTAAGAAISVLGVLAACTVARTIGEGARAMSGPRDPGPRGMEGYSPDPRE